MADIEISRNVAQTVEGPALPKTYQRHVQAQVTQNPDIQSAGMQFASASNWMSAIGSEVAAKASQAIASQIGTNLGKNPKGDLGASFSEFDKMLNQSYSTQAQAVLGLQANKLITDTNVELARQPRLTPDMISKAQESIGEGLSEIIKNAPNDIKANLEYQLGNQAIHQSAQLTERMISEQKQDQKNNIDLASKTNAENAYTMSMSGNDKAAENLIESTKRINESGVASRIVTPEAAKVASDSVRLSAEKGRITREYEEARQSGKGEEYLKDVADGKKGVAHSSPDYLPVSQHLITYVGHEASLRNQDEQLRLAQFQTSISQNVMGITGTDLQNLKENVSPIAFEKAQLSYLNGVKSFNNDLMQGNNALAAWNDPGSFARLTEKAINQGFDVLVNRKITDSQKSGVSMSQDQAEVDVAASAGGQIPVFTKELKNKINSANPAMMDAAAVQVQELLKRNAGHALSGLTDSDKSVIAQYKSLRDSLPADEAARTAITNANQDYDTQQANKAAFQNKIKKATSDYTITPSQHGLQMAGLKPKEFFNAGIANEYGNLIVHKYGTYYQMLNRDDKVAQQLVKEDVQQNFGYTKANGGSYMTLHPLEKVLGYGDNHDVVPFIQQDVINTLVPKFKIQKEAFDSDKTNEYWEVVERDRVKKSMFSTSYEPIQVKHHVLGSKGKVTETYDVILNGNSFNWDISLNTASGTRPIMQIAPYLGISTYTPNKNEIDAAYIKAYGVK